MCVLFLYFVVNKKLKKNIFHFIGNSRNSVERSLFGWRGARGRSLSPAVKMATPLGILKDCTHPSLNETLKSHNSVTFKLVKTGMLICITLFEMLKFFELKYNSYTQ